MIQQRTLQNVMPWSLALLDLIITLLVFQSFKIGLADGLTAVQR